MAEAAVPEVTVIPIDECKWHRLPDEELKLPPGHYADYARTDDGSIVARITGPNAHVLGQDKNLWAAVSKALGWFRKVGEAL